jgi:ubiquinone biosynthesis protein
LPQQDRPRRLRLVCEDLGPTFVKLGQLLSTRPDLLPEAYTNELASLRDDVKTFPFGEVESILNDEYGRPPGQIFASLDEKPVASASISQVHRAILHDGRVVALKVQRPDIAKVVQADLDIIKNLAQLIERRIPNLAVYRPLVMAREFERTIKRELDFSRERRTIERCRLQFAKDRLVHIPLTFPDLSTSRVLAMEFIEGVPINDIDGIRLLGSTPEEIAVAGARILLKQVFEFGFFHADPHPGNLRVLPGGVIVPLDYGLFGHLDLRTRERIAGLLGGLLSQDADRVIRALESLEIRRDHSDARGFRRDVAELVSAYSDLTLDSINLSVLLRDLIGIIRTHHLSIPPDLVLLIRAIVTIESVGRNLDPHFDIAAQLQPFLRDEMLRRFRPDRILSQTVRTTA